VLGLAKAVVRDFQLTVLIRRRKCTTLEKSILKLQLLELVSNDGVAHIVCNQMHTLLYDSPSSLMPEAEQVLHVLGHHSHAGIEVRVPKVRHGLKALLPHGVFLVPNQEKRDGHRGGSDKVALTQVGECDVCHLLDSGVGLTADDGFRPRLNQIERYHHVGLAYVQDVDHRQAVAVDRNFPAVAEANECVI
jgi:hypothetical protein